MASSTKSIEEISINTIRTLSMDAVEAAASGHPGTPMALAPVTYHVWNHVLRYDPRHPLWPARDRFVLSCGHASMLLYAALHLAGVRQVREDGTISDELAVPLDHIRRFRQWGSRCPGHPEYHETTGVETTTGPLGQGIGNSVGMAVAGRWLAAQFDRPEYEMFGFNVYALCSDGDFMEGVGQEAASLAGHLGLANLCWIYDDNRITIEGDTSLAYSEDVGAKFRALGWHVAHVEDANDLDAISQSLDSFLATTDRPTLIIVRSHIAWGAPNKQDTHGAHGSPLGEEEIRLTKQVYGWDEDAKFLVPEDVIQHFQEHLGQRGEQAHTAWEEKFAAYQQAHPELAEKWENMQARKLPANWDAELPTFETSENGVASRASSGKVLNAVAAQVPWMLGGSADLAPSTKTTLTAKEETAFSVDSPGGRNFHFGVREHGMASAINGMALCGLRPYGATFFVFSDYLRPSMRLASLMGLPVIYIFTHDSIGVGEDGPTHQPVEHLAALRAIPGLVTFRPGDANEVREMWRWITPQHHRPVAVVLTRQNLPTLDREKFASSEGTQRGAYVLADPAKGEPKVILIASGSELSIAVAAFEELQQSGIPTRVVSMPSQEVFAEQDAAYHNSVLPPGIKARIAIEAGVELGWRRYLGEAGRFIGMDRFGASAPYKELYEQFGITAANVVETARQLL